MNGIFCRLYKTLEEALIGEGIYPNILQRFIDDAKLPKPRYESPFVFNKIMKSDKPEQKKLDALSDGGFVKEGDYCSLRRCIGEEYTIPRKNIGD